MCLAQQYYDKQRRVTIIKKPCILQSAKLHVIGDFEEMLSSAILWQTTMCDWHLKFMHYTRRNQSIACIYRLDIFFIVIFQFLLPRFKIIVFVSFVSDPLCYSYQLSVMWVLKTCLAQQYYDKQRWLTVIKKSCISWSANQSIDEICQ